MYTEEDLITIFNEMKIKDEAKNLSEILSYIKNAKSLTEKCLLLRKYFSPQSTHIEHVIKKDLLLENAKDNVSGDAIKNNIKYEIKSSIHAKKSKVNFVQIRPDHDIDYYIFVLYNLHDSNNSSIGNAYIFKIPSEVVYDMVVKHGGYAHGILNKLNNITKENLKGRNCEYALRFTLNVKNKKSKSYLLWDEFQKYKVEYSEKNF